MISEKTWALRQEILRLLGGKCTCHCGCADTNLRHLQLDHLNGGGKDDRKTVRGQAVYTRLLAEMLSGQVTGILTPLCANCHFEKTMHGGCTNPPDLHGGLQAEITEKSNTSEYEEDVGNAEKEQREERGVYPRISTPPTESLEQPKEQWWKGYLRR